jgi:hypothetical protein
MIASILALGRTLVVISVVIAFGIAVVLYRFGASVGTRPLHDIIVLQLLCLEQSLLIPRTPVGTSPLQALEIAVL